MSREKCRFRASSDEWFDCVGDASREAGILRGRASSAETSVLFKRGMSEETAAVNRHNED